MISESLYFKFAGRDSTDFNILNIAVNSSGAGQGLYTEPFMTNRTINEVKIRGLDNPYLIDVTRDPITLTLSFYFNDSYDDDLIREVARWLNVDSYQPLIFSENLSRVYYAMPVNDIQLIHNGLKQGYLNLTMRCDSPYSYSEYIQTPWYVTSISSLLTISLDNKGDLDILPELTIQKNGDGDITITNLSKANNQLVLTSLEDQEELYMNGEGRFITTSIPNVERYDNFNDYYLTLFYGQNNLQIQGNCKIQFRYQFKYIT